MACLPEGQHTPARGDGTGSICFRLTLERLPVLARHDGDEALQRALPLSQLAFRPRAAGEVRVLLHQTPQKIALAELRHVCKLDQSFVALPLELAELVEHERDTPAHSRSEISADASKHDDSSTGHVLAAMVADSF